MSEAKKYPDFDSEQITLDKVSNLIHLSNLEVHNPELYQELNKLDTNSKRVIEIKKVIDLGTFVKSKVQMMMDTDFVNLRVKSMVDEFNQGMDSTKSEILELVQQNFDPSKTDSYSDKLNRFFNNLKEDLQKTINSTTKELIDGKDQIKKSIDDTLNPDLSTSYLAKVSRTINDFKTELDKSFDFGREGSIANQLKMMLDSNFGDNGKVIKAVEKKLSFDNPNSTFNLLQSNITRQLNEIKQEIELIKKADELQKEANKKSTQKGYDFEDQVLDALENIASSNGDLVEDLTTKSGSTGSSKKGDFNYTVKSINKVIAIEARDRDTISTPSTLIKELDKTKTNRNADFTIYLTASEEQLHKQIGMFQEYDSDKIVTHFGLLQVAFKVAISRMIIEHESIDEVDKAAVEKEISNIESTLKSFSGLKSAATNIKKEADKITAKADEIKIDISNSLISLNELLFSQGTITE
ncbi:MAG: hypothetical protein QY331_01945 [Melioribacteraceae bacterium]|nr:MAG: hypothetical protein QY331_01945 [Melioribacteraceae bacterium]